MIHPDTILRPVSEEIGYGVFATQLIPRGTVTWVRDELDQTMSPARIAAVPPIHRDLLWKYTFRTPDGNLVLCWDIARFMNHSCAPTCLGTGYDFEVAVRDILPGEELTDDYATLHLLPEESFDCHCGSPGCRRRITSDDAARLAGQWDALLRKTLPLLEKIPQPLRPLLRQEDVVMACENHGIRLGVMPSP